MELLSASPARLEAARALLEEYVRLPDAWERHGGIPTELPTLFTEEIAAFPGSATPPFGDVVIAVVDRAVVGAGHLVPFRGDACELKRVFVRSGQRREGFGARMAEAMIDRARSLGYQRAVIDVMPERLGAISFWKSLAFTLCEPYREYPFEMTFLERPLDSKADPSATPLHR